MGKKARLKAIKQATNSLPVINTLTHETSFVKGAEILSWGTITEIDGKKINPETMYQVNDPVLLARNHSRRLKKAFLKHGTEGITQYFKNVLSTVKANT